MCGIAGVVNFKHKSEEPILHSMINTLSHRGPDALNKICFKTEQYFLGLGHTRLSIIDLSPNANQPMSYKQYHIVFNGEIYNYKIIRKELELLGHNFISGSDTEVILHAFEEWGNLSVDKFIGMFAFALYDHVSSNIFLFRDRAGVKPLYYYYKNDLFLFASELKAFHKHPDFKRDLNLSAVGSYFNYGYIPSPHCIFENTFKLEPGKFLSFNLKNREITINTFWDVSACYKTPKLKIDYNDAKEELTRILKSAFEYRMVADVPVGVFLSGGYDSSAVIAILQSNRSQKLKTFTIGFKEGNNEAPFAAQIATYLGTDHNEYICTEKDAQDIIPSLPHFYDEPFADSSAIPTILVSRLAREQVKVALSADGGDEIFIGYNNYRRLQLRSKKLDKIPSLLKPAFRNALKAASTRIPKDKVSLQHKLYQLSLAIDGDSNRQMFNLHRFSFYLPNYYRRTLYQNSSISFNDAYVLGTGVPNNSGIELAALYDYKAYMRDDILVKVDRATMSVSLEGRDPFLDHRIIEFAAQLPFEYKFNAGGGKRILKDIVYDYIPREMMERPKTGFSLPLSKWLRHELSYLLDEYLNNERLKEAGLFDPQFVREQIELFRIDKLHYITFIWKLLMFQMWFDYWCR